MVGASNFTVDELGVFHSAWGEADFVRLPVHLRSPEGWAMTCETKGDLRAFLERRATEPGCVFDVGAVYAWACETPGDMIDHASIQTAPRHDTRGVLDEGFLIY